MFGACRTKHGVFEIDLFRQAGRAHRAPRGLAVNEAEGVSQVVQDLFEQAPAKHAGVGRVP